MKRILIFSTAYIPHVGGAEIAIQEITKRIDGYEFELVCARFDPKLPAQEQIGNVLVQRLGFGSRAIDKLLLPFLSAGYALSRRFDCYWAMMVTYGSLGAYIAQLSTRTPIILTLQEGDPPAYLRRKWFGLIALSWKYALAQSSAVTVISSYLGKLAQEFGYEGEPVLIPNGVETSTFSAAPRSTHEGTVLITTSRLVHKNAVDDIIRALALLPGSVSFSIYGTGPDEAMLRSLARELGVETRVHFKGQIPYSELPAALAEADIFIRPSRSEGMGNSFIEAMAAKLPVIATQEGGIKDFLFDAKRNPDAATTGFAVSVNAPEEIAAAVTHILEHPQEVEATVANASRLVAERYQWSGIAKAMRGIFGRVTDKTVQ